VLFRDSSQDLGTSVCGNDLVLGDRIVINPGVLDEEVP